VSFGLTTLNRLLKRKLKLFYGKPKVVNLSLITLRSERENYLMLEKIMEVIKNDEIIMYFDESTFNNVKRPIRKWQGKSYNQKQYTKGRLPSKKLLMIVTNQKMIHYKINDCNTNTKEIIKFFTETVNRLRQDFFLKEDFEKREFGYFLDNTR